MKGWPITKYDVAQIKKYLLIFLIAIVSIFLIGNTINAFLADEIKAFIPFSNSRVSRR